MKQITCEMCGGTDLVKQDGMFVCQTCGAKYSVEEAKKMMVEGTVSVVGTVSIDNSASYDRIVELAKDAYTDKRWESAYDYYCQAVDIKRNDAENVLRQGLSILGKDGVQSSVPSSCTNRVTRAIDLLKEMPQERRNQVIESFLADIKSVCDSAREVLDEEISDLESTKLATRGAGDILADLGRPVFVAQQNQNEDKKIERHNKSVDEKISVVRSRQSKITDFENEFSNKVIDCADTNLQFVVFYKRGDLQKVQELYPSITLSAEEKKSLVTEKNLIQSAVSNISIQQVKILIEMGADVNDGKKSAADGTTPLFSLTAYARNDQNRADSLEIVKILLDNGAFVDGDMKLYTRSLLNTDTDPAIKDFIISRHPEMQAKITDAPKSGGCYVATAVYGSYDCPQVWTLRRYRDYTLAETWYGRLFIRTYYAISPTIVKWFGHTEWFRNMWQGKLDNLVEKLNSSGVENTPYQDKKW